MSVKLYAHKRCPTGFKVRIAAQYLGVAIEAPEYDCTKGAKSPLGQWSPVLETAEGLIYGGDAAARYVARDSALLRGTTAFEAALIDQWMEYAAHDVGMPAAAWVLPAVCPDVPALPAAIKKAKADLRKVMGILNTHLLTRTFFVGERATMADISMFCTLLDAYRNVLDPGFRKEFKNLNRWFVTMAHQPPVAAVVGEVVLCTKAAEPKLVAEPAAAAAAAEKPKKEQPKKEQPKKEQPKKEQPKKEQAPAAAPAGDEEEEEKPREKKPPNPLDLLPPSKMTMDEWKRCYSNEDTKTVAIPWFWEHYDPEGFSLWFCHYKHELEASHVFMVSNLIGGWIQRLDPLRKYGFGSLIIFGEQKPFEIRGLWLFRGKEIPKEMLDCDDTELYEWRRADPVADKTEIEEFLAWEGNFGGRKFNQAKIYK